MHFDKNFEIPFEAQKKMVAIALSEFIFKFHFR